MIRIPRSIIALSAVAACGLLAAGCGGGEPQVMQSCPAETCDKARDVLLGATENPDGVTRSRALEALGGTEGVAASQAYVRALQDEVVGVRFAAAMAAGDCLCQPAADRLRQMALSAKTDPKVRLAVFYALHRLGDKRFTNKIGRMLIASDPEVRANAVLVIAKIGDSRGITPLRSRLEDERHSGVRLEIAEALAALGEPRSIALLYAYVRSGQLYESCRAVQALGRTRSRQARAIIRWAFTSDKPLLLRLAAAGALGRLGDDRGYDMVVKAALGPQALVAEQSDTQVALTVPQQEQIQLRAALALGQMGRNTAVDVLAPMLDHKNPTVAIAAAKGVLALLDRSSATPADPSSSGRIGTSGHGSRPGRTVPVMPGSGGPSVETAPAKD